MITFEYDLQLPDLYEDLKWKQLSIFLRYIADKKYPLKKKFYNNITYHQNHSETIMIGTGISLSEGYPSSSTPFSSNIVIFWFSSCAHIATSALTPSELYR